MKGSSNHSGERVESFKSHLVQGIYQWAVENGLTPQVLVAASHPDAVVPTNYVENDQIVLNIHPASVRDFNLDLNAMWFSARFGGQPFNVTIPLDALVAVFARKNGQGIFFQANGTGFVTPSGDQADSEDPEVDPPTSPEPDEPHSTDEDEPPPSGPSHLKLVR